MTETYTLDGEPLSVCSTNALVERLAEPWVAKLAGSAGYRDAIQAELATRSSWGPTPYERAVAIPEGDRKGFACRRADDCWFPECSCPQKPIQLKSGVRPVLCEDCGKNPADLPSRLCPGCEAYCEHTQFVP